MACFLYVIRIVLAIMTLTKHWWHGRLPFPDILSQGLRRLAYFYHVSLAGTRAGEPGRFTPGDTAATGQLTWEPGARRHDQDA
jgi:hypothetical protein